MGYQPTIVRLMFLPGRLTAFLPGIHALSCAARFFLISITHQKTP